MFENVIYITPLNIATATSEKQFSKVQVEGRLNCYKTCKKNLKEIFVNGNIVFRFPFSINFWHFWWNGIAFGRKLISDVENSDFVNLKRRRKVCGFEV